MLLYSCVIHLLLDLSNAMLIYSCAYMLSLCCSRLITALVDTAAWSSRNFSAFSFRIAVDAWLRRYAFALPCALLLMTDIQLCLLYVRFATYVLLLRCARLITPLVEAQRDVHIQLRHICFCLAARD